VALIYVRPGLRARTRGGEDRGRQCKPYRDTHGCRDAKTWRANEPAQPRHLWDGVEHVNGMSETYRGNGGLRSSMSRRRETTLC
jgi:hypothetical protein